MIRKSQAFALKLACCLSGCALTLSVAHAWDFSYGFQNAYSANADTYVVGLQNVRKYTEWQTPPVTYWGPSANDVAAALTMRFDFSAPTSELFLKAPILSYQGLYEYGFSSLWASKDGSSWQLLLNNPLPSSGPVTLTYNQDVPASLLGSSSFWLQVRMQEHNARPVSADPRATFADAEFCRVEPPSSGNIFQLNANLVPEPAVGQLAVLALGLAGFLSRRVRP